MLIKQTGLTFRLPRSLSAVFVLTGQEPLQQNTLAQLIKNTWCQHHDEVVESTVIHINTASDWQHLDEEANSYSLFSTTVLMDVHYDKKTLDAAGKAFFERYLQQVNSRCLILVRAPELALKQLTQLVNHEQVQVIAISSPAANEVRQWISTRLKDLCAGFDPALPQLIQQYNEGNLLACSQVLDKLALVLERDQFLSLDEVKDQLVNQCAWSLYDLANACLSGDKAKALLLLRQAAGDKTEPTLVLWLLTQEVRLLMQLQSCTTQTTAFRDKANQLKIWSSRLPLYQSACGKYSQSLLQILLRFCNKLDNDIKTGQNGQVWNSFELLALSLCSGQQIGYLA